MKELEYLELKEKVDNFLIGNSIKESEQCFIVE